MKTIILATRLWLAKIWEEANVGETIKLFLHHHLREDSDELYGFTDLETLYLYLSFFFQFRALALNQP